MWIARTCGICANPNESVRTETAGPSLVDKVVREVVFDIICDNKLILASSQIQAGEEQLIAQNLNT